MFCPNILLKKEAKLKKQSGRPRIPSCVCGEEIIYTLSYVIYVLNMFAFDNCILVLLCAYDHLGHYELQLYTIAKTVSVIYSCLPQEAP